jgi:AcrR family transcriptional regulator
MDNLVASQNRIGRRERGKLDKRRRICEATRDVFCRKGYEAATTREIAERADVAIGTLFAYARDKRELLMMVINNDREALPPVPPADPQTAPDTLTALIGFFEPRYRYWAREPELSRLAVQQTVDYSLVRDPGPELARFEKGRQGLINQLAEFFHREQREGRVVTDQSPSTIAWLFMTLYQGQVRKWLRAQKPDVVGGLKELRALFALALTGVDRKAPAGTRRGAPKKPGPKKGKAR